MQNYYPHCIFCFKELTETDRKGTGEHIIPDVLYGSLCMKDVCARCNNELGRIADRVALEDARIISAAFELHLPELQAKIRDQGTGKMVDESGEPDAPVRFRNGKPRVVARRVSDELFACDERDAQKHLLSRLRKDERHGMDHEEVVRIVENDLMPRYNRLRPGESVSEQRLGVRLRKAPGKIYQKWRVTERAAERLVAKIGYETAFLVLDRDCLAAMPVLEHLAAVAMGHGQLDKSILMYPPNRYSPVDSSKDGPKYHHQIIAWAQDAGTFIDIYFFGCVGFRLWLRGDSPASRNPFPHPDGDLNMTSFLMTFEPEQSRSKHFFLRRAGSEEIEEYAATGLL